MNIRQLSYYSGTSGLLLPIPKYKFPPEHESSSRLQYYATFFNSIEINSTFYKLPLKTTLTKWSNSVGEDFKFTLKLWKQITHNKGLQFDAGDVDKFMEIADHVGEKKGCILVQFPPSTKIGSIGQLELLLGTLKKKVKNNWSVAVEFRDSSWYHEEVYTILKKFKSVLVIHDKSGASSPFINDPSDVVYVRFHGPTGNYRGSYSDEFLSEYASYVKDWLIQGKRVYVYFNNTVGGAFNNVNTINNCVELVTTEIVGYIN